jgi:tetratricopeptide (TPR) repeat protein
LLVVAAGPAGEAELDSEAELAIIQQAVDKSRRMGHLDLDILEYASLDSLRERIKHFQPHILHYTGHGGKLPYLNETFLCLETEDGGLSPLFGDEFKNILAAAKELHLVVLSGCMTAQTHNSDALRGVGTGLLRSIPALVAMQYSILDKSGIKFAEKFYSELARGESVSSALQETRLTLKNLRSVERADWGLPTLYQRAEEVILLDTAAPPRERKPEMLEVGGLPPVKGFVGRKKELRKLQKSVADPQNPVIYIWGLGGIGKTALTAKLLEKLKQQHAIDSVKVIRCDKIDPTLATVVDSMASFIRLQEGAGYVEAAQYLMESRLGLEERVAKFHQYLANERFMFIFDNLESFFVRREPVGELEDKELEKFFSCLFEYSWAGTFLFTCRYQWRLLTPKSQKTYELGCGLPSENILNQELKGLTASQSLQRMGHLPNLSKLEYKKQVAVLNLIKGHPKYMDILDAYATKKSLDKVLADPRLKGLVLEEVGKYFMDGLWEDINEAERLALAQISVFRLPIGDDELPRLLPDMGVMDKLRGYSLVQAEDGGLWVHPVVREYALSQYPDDKQREFHRQAVEFYVGRFGEIAEKARDEGHDPIKILAQLAEYLAKKGQVDQARYFTTTLLECHHHLLVWQEYERAGGIVTAIYDFLAMQGERELAKELLNKSIQTLKGFNKNVAKGNLATLLNDEGKWEEALAVYDECIDFFRKEDAKPQVAVGIGQKAQIYQQRGDYTKALELEKESLKLEEEMGNKEGIVISRYRISQLLHCMKKYDQALTEGEKGLEMAKDIGNQQLEAAFLHHLGLTLNSLNKPEKAMKSFQESLKIKEEIGDKAGQGNSLGEIGKLFRRAGRYKEAMGCFQRALQIAQELSDPVKVAIWLESIGMVFEEQEHYKEALARYQQALELKQKFSSPQGIAITKNNIARVQAEI